MNTITSSGNQVTESTTPAVLVQGITVSGNQRSRESSPSSSESRACLARMKPCPPSGGGVHRWGYHAACICIDAGLTDSEAVPYIEERMTRPPNPSNEVEAALASRRGGHVVGASVSSDSGIVVRRSKWPSCDATRAAKIASYGPTLSEVRELSPVMWTDDAPHTTEILGGLFSGNPLLCCSARLPWAHTRSREEWGGRLSRYELIVPSPMSARWGVTQAGKQSAHTLSNTGPRRFLVIEFDSGPADGHAAILWHLKHYERLALINHSGGKSLHGWFYCDAQSDEVLRKFMRYAVSLGADPATWTRSQFVRMPDGLRDRTIRQKVHYFNPAAVGGAK